MPCLFVLFLRIMSRIVETREDNANWLLWKLGNLLAIDSDYVKSVGVAWLFKENGEWVFKPRITGKDSLYYNAVFFVRLCFAPGMFIGVRWSNSSVKKSLWQFGIGWKINGRFAMTFRIQSDESSAKGTTGPNYGQATGFNYGTH